MKVKQDIGYQCDAAVAERVKLLRTRTLGMDQKDFAKVLGVSQAIVSQWENRRYSPTPMALKAMAQFAPREERAWWFEKAGDHHARVEELTQKYKETFQVNEQNERTVLVYGSAGAGPFRFVPQESEGKIAIPRAWASETASLVGLRITGDSMWPLIMSGSIVIVDLSRRSPKELCGRLVAASDGEGVSVKYLRKAGKSYLLVPKNVTVDNQIVPFTDDHHVVGEVIFHMTEAKLLWE